MLFTSETNSPFSIISFKRLPRSDPEATSALSKSPDERWQNPYFSTIRAHWVPLPDPGPPENDKHEHENYKSINKLMKMIFQNGCLQVGGKLHGWTLQIFIA